MAKRLRQVGAAGILICAAVSCQERVAGFGPGEVGVATVSVTPPAATVTVSGSFQLSATARDSGGQTMSGRTFQWTSSATTIATVDANGRVVGTSAGTATIRAAIGDKTGQSTITVTSSAVQTVEVTPPAASVLINTTVQLTATPRDAAGQPLTGRPVTWRSSDSTRAQVSTSGVVTGRVIGSATITATSGGRSGTASITVTQVPVATLEVQPTSASLLIAGTRQLTATPRDASGNVLTFRPITWQSSDTTKVRVNGTGLVTGVGAGTAAVTATCEGKTVTASIDVSVAPVATVTVNPGTTSVLVNSTVQLAAVLRDANGTTLTGRPITWTTSNDQRAQVNSSGLVLGLGSGTVTITATSEGRSGTATVTVTAAPVATVTVNPSSATIASAATQQLTTTLRDAAGNILTGRTVTWSTNNQLVAQVSSAGLVLGVAAGTATITATCEGRTGTATITVTAPAPGTVLFTESFDNNLFGNRGWYDLAGPTISTTEKHSGTAALEARWNSGGFTSTVGVMRKHFTPSSSLYVSYWVKYSANYVGSNRPYHPHEFHIVSSRDADYASLASTYMGLYIEQNYQNGGIPRLSIQDNLMINIANIGVDLTGVTENRSVGGCNGDTDGTGVPDCYNVSGNEWYNARTWDGSGVGFRPTAGADYKADWNHVEVYFQLNTVVGGIGQTNGIVRYWLNGNLKIDHTNVLFRTGANPTIQFKQFVFAPYIGDGSPVAQTMWVDDLTVGTARP